MHFNRRRFMASMIGTAGVAACNQFRFPAPVFAATSPELLAADPRRPQFHLLPAANWMNDPNGPIYWNGSYHMFYQYNPNGAFWGDMHWGHAVSADMVHWKHLPVALSPTPGGPDADGCFSGTAVVQDGQVVMLYTGVRNAPVDQATIKDGVHSLRETQCLATSNDAELKTWSKQPEPVIAAPPAGLQVTGFRDPSPWRQGDRWYMVVGSGMPHKGGAVLLYASNDLHTWDYLHVVAGGDGNGSNTANPVDSGDMWECPDLFALGDKHVLIYSSEGKAHWQTGVLDAKEMLFHPEQKGILDYGAFYAPKTQLDKSGNRILWGWIAETRKLEEYKAAGWAGMMSLPRVLTVDSDGRLRVNVATEVNQLRKPIQSVKITAEESQNQLQIGKLRIEACCGEISCNVRRDAAFELSLRDGGSSESAVPCIALKYDFLHPDRILADGTALPLALHEHEALELKFYIDGSVIEVFVNGQAAYTKRFYYGGSRETNMSLKWTGKTANIESLSLWQLSPISRDRLTT